MYVFDTQRVMITTDHFKEPDTTHVEMNRKFEV